MDKYNKQDIDQGYLEFALNNLTYAIHNNKQTCYVGYIILNEDEIKEYWLKKETWIKYINVCIESGIELEEYEMCDKFNKLKNILK